MKAEIFIKNKLKRSLNVTLEQLEARLKNLENFEIEARLKLRSLEDIEEIKKLQRTYGFYITHWMGQEIIDLFSNSPDISVVLWVGKFLGKEGIKRYFLGRKPNPELLFAIMQISGVVDVASDGKTAKGRWFGYGYEAVPVKKGGVWANYCLGVYENEYVKEDGKWKFKKLEFRLIFSCPFDECWVKQDRLVPKPEPSDESFKPDLPFTTDEEKFPTRYPSGRILPFHYKNPVTGK